LEGDDLEGDDLEGDDLEGGEWTNESFWDDMEGDMEGDDMEGDMEGDDLEGDDLEGDDLEGDDLGKLPESDQSGKLPLPDHHILAGHHHEAPLEGTEEYIKYMIDTEGFSGLESYLRLDMPTIYEEYANGMFEWQHSSVVPSWLQPDLTNIYGGAKQYEDLIKFYKNDANMSRNLERVGTAVRAPNVIRYFNSTHGEMHSLWHNGTLDADKIENITQGNMPGFAYNSEGHIVLRNDTTIDHGFNHNRKIVQYYDPQTDKGIAHHQMDFANAVSKHLPKSVAQIPSAETQTPGTDIQQAPEA